MHEQEAPIVNQLNTSSMTFCGFEMIINVRRARMVHKLG